MFVSLERSERSDRSADVCCSLEDKLLFTANRNTHGQTTARPDHRTPRPAPTPPPSQISLYLLKERQALIVNCTQERNNYKICGLQACQVSLKPVHTAGLKLRLQGGGGSSSRGEGGGSSSGGEGPQGMDQVF